MSLKISNLKRKLKTKKRAKKIKKIRQNKNKLKTNEIKANISNDSIIKNKSITQIFEFNSISEMCNFLDSITPNIRLKLLINYNKEKYFIFKTELHQKKEHKIKKDTTIENYQYKGLSSKEIAKLFKAFYSEDEFKFSDSIKKKQLNKKLKLAIAPKQFTVENDHLTIENRYANVISIEHINNSCIFENIVNNINAWLSIDCYKIDNKFILEKLNQMKTDKSIEKTFTDSIIAKIDDVVEMLQEETIFQCEIRLLLYNNDLEQLKSDSELIMDNLTENYCTSYIPQEKINTRKWFEKSIYPGNNLDIINSITATDLLKMIGCEENV